MNEKLSKDIGPEAEAEQKKTFFDFVQVYHDYSVKSLLDEANFGMRDGLLYSKISYQEIQYFNTWKIIFDRNKDFEPLFLEDYKAYLKKNKLEPRFKI